MKNLINGLLKPAAALRAALPPGLLALAAFALNLKAAGPELWLYEGLITNLDEELVPDLKSGWVLSGSFMLDPDALEPEPEFIEGHSRRLSGGVTETELTIDLYYQVHFEAMQVPGMAGLDYANDDPAEDGRDLLCWYFPMRGKLKETEWSLRWLQVWLADPEGRMISSVPPDVPARGFEWKTGWFRMTFQNEAGDAASVDGMVEIFCPESALGKQPDDWPSIVADLGSRLHERDRTIDGLTTELYEVRSRLDGLSRMVDLLVEERDHLLDETRRLEEIARLVDPDVVEEIATLQADKALLEAGMQEQEEARRRLEESLSEAESERLHLRAQVMALEEAVAIADAAREAAERKTREVREVASALAVETAEPVDRPKRQRTAESETDDRPGLRPWRLR